MLVLSRQVDQTIMIGDDIEVTVVDIRGDKVRLGITAPKEIAVHRKEVYEAIKRENRDAGRIKPEDVPHLGKMTGNGGNSAAPGGPKPPGTHSGGPPQTPPGVVPPSNKPDASNGNGNRK